MLLGPRYGKGYGLVTTPGLVNPPGNGGGNGKGNQGNGKGNGGLGGGGAGGGSGGGTVGSAPNTISGNKVWLDSQYGTYQLSTAAKFIAASSQSLSITSNPTVQLGDIDYTIAMWVCFETLGAVDKVFIGKDAASNREFYVQYRWTGTVGILRGAVFRSAGTVESTVTSSVTPTVNKWYLVIFSHDSTNDTVNISINNGATDSAPTGGSLDAGSSAPFVLGARSYATFENYLDGRIQNVGLWKRLLTPTEKTSLYNGGIGKNYSELSASEKTSMVSFWACNETSGSRADSFGTNTLTSNNAVSSNSGISKGSPTTTAGQYVGVWLDKSSLGNHFYNLTLTPPTLGSPISGIGNKQPISFSSSRLSSDYDNGIKPITYAAVVVSTGTGVRYLVSGADGAAGTGLLVSTTPWQLVVNTSGVGASTSNLTSGVPYVLVVTYDGSSNYKYYINGTLDASGTSAFTPASGKKMMVGGISIFDVSTMYDGHLAELVVYDNALSATNVTNLTKYLGNKYGIVVA